MLEGRKFVLTDHKPLTFAFKQKLDKTSRRQTTHLDYISQITTDIRHIQGTENVVSGCLSRIDEIKNFNYEKLSELQNADPELKKILAGFEKSSLI